MGVIIIVGQTMISFKQFLINESIVDFERETRDPAVFVNPERSKKPLINPSIISQIVQAVPAFSRFGSIVQVSVIGSILTHRWTSHSDIDVNILVDRNKPDEQTQEMLNDLCRQVNGKPASGTAHPINYYVSFQDDYNEDNFANIYDVYSNKWRKQTEDPTIDINDFLDEFGKRVAEIDIGIGSLRRNLIDFRKIRQLSPKQLRNGATMCRARLRNISNTISGMEDVKAEMKISSISSWNTIGTGSCWKI